MHRENVDKTRTWSDNNKWPAIIKIKTCRTKYVFLARLAAADSAIREFVLQDAHDGDMFVIPVYRTCLYIDRKAFVMFEAERSGMIWLNLITRGNTISFSYLSSRLNLNTCSLSRETYALCRKCNLVILNWMQVKYARNLQMLEVCSYMTPVHTKEIPGSFHSSFWNVNILNDCLTWG